MFMKKEKTVRTYQRRTKTGKIVTVRQHTASYEAAKERIKEKVNAGGKNEYMYKRDNGKYRDDGDKFTYDKNIGGDEFYNVVDEYDYKDWHDYITGKNPDPEEEFDYDFANNFKEHFGKTLYEKYRNDVKRKGGYYKKAFNNLHHDIDKTAKQLHQAWNGTGTTNGILSKSDEDFRDATKGLLHNVKAWDNKNKTWTKKSTFDRHYDDWNGAYWTASGKLSDLIPNFKRKGWTCLQDYNRNYRYGPRDSDVAIWVSPDKRYKARADNSEVVIYPIEKGQVRSNSDSDGDLYAFKHKFE